MFIANENLRVIFSNCLVYFCFIDFCCTAFNSLEIEDLLTSAQSFLKLWRIVISVSRKIFFTFYSIIVKTSG